jgi:FG-GAP-like repeat
MTPLRERRLLGGVSGKLIGAVVVVCANGVGCGGGGGLAGQSPSGTAGDPGRCANGVGPMADAGPGGLRPLRFLAGRSYVAGLTPEPENLAIADLDGDGKLDLVVPNLDADDPGTPGAPYYGSVSVLINDCDGSFAPRIVYRVGSSYSFRLAMADLNGDARADFVVAGADGMSAWLNRGDGTFREGGSYPVDGDPTALTVVDVDGDGRGDVVSMEENSAGTEVEVFRNRGDGIFSAATAFTAAEGTSQNSLVAADLNGDGRLDLVTKSAVGGGATVLMNTGAGAFAAPIGYLSGVSASAMRLADVDGDGTLDLVLTSSSYGSTASFSVNVLLNDGTGAFTDPVVYPMSNAPNTLDVADLDGDARPDLVVSDDLGEVAVLLNQGGGAFTAGTPTPRGAGGASLALADMNGDQAADLVVDDFGQLSVSLNDGRGGFGAPRTYDGPDGTLTLADLEGDGVLDVVIKYEGDGHVAVLSNEGDGTLAVAPVAVDGSPMHVLATGDFDGDGHVDLALAGQSSNGASSIMRIALNDGTGAFTIVVDYPFAGVVPSAIAVGDINHDGTSDVAVLTAFDSQVNVLLNQGHGTFGPAVAYPAGTNPGSLAIADLDGDGAVDLVIADEGKFPPDPSPAQLASIHGSVRVLYNRGDGTFVPPIDTTVSGSPGVAAGDLDGDGAADLAVNDVIGGTVTILLSRGRGTFAAPASYPSAASGAILIADLNGDGAADVMVGPQVFLNHGDGTFAAGITYPVGDPGVVGDFNGDGTTDLGEVSSTGEVTILLNDGRATFAAPGSWGWVGGSSPSGIAVADFDGNGEPDLALLDGYGVSLLLNTTR